MNQQAIERLQVKTPEHRFLSILKKEFHEPPRVAQALLEEAQACLLGRNEPLRAGQMRVTLARRGAKHGQPLADTPMTEVVWTIDAGLEDRQVMHRRGRRALRRVRILRLLSEAVEQDAAATQEDLAHVLQVSVRTIKRDCAFLRSQGIFLPMRGDLQGIGRGQTHKTQIVGRWLQGETYDQIALHTHHSLISIRRYVQTFVRVIHLHTQGFVGAQIASLLSISRPVVTEYLAIHQQCDSPLCQQRLADHMERMKRPVGPQPPKKGAT
jgi:hypothetical protein